MKIYVDGSSRGNPGLAEAHWVIEDPAEDERKKKELGIHTGNYAEIASIGCALKYVRDTYGTNKELYIFTDSQTAYFWVTRGNIGRVKEREKIVAMANKIRNMISQFKYPVKVITVRREQNIADPGYK